MKIRINLLFSFFERRKLMSLQLIVVQFMIGIASAGAWFWIERKFFGNK